MQCTINLILDKFTMLLLLTRKLFQKTKALTFHVHSFASPITTLLLSTITNLAYYIENIIKSVLLSFTQKRRCVEYGVFIRLCVFLYKLPECLKVPKYFVISIFSENITSVGRGSRPCNTEEAEQIFYCTD